MGYLKYLSTTIFTCRTFLGDASFLPELQEQLAISKILKRLLYRFNSPESLTVLSPSPERKLFGGNSFTQGLSEYLLLEPRRNRGGSISFIPHTCNSLRISGLSIRLTESTHFAGYKVRRIDRFVMAGAKSSATEGE